MLNFKKINCLLLCFVRLFYANYHGLIPVTHMPVVSANKGKYMYQVLAEFNTESKCNKKNVQILYNFS